MKNDFLPHPRPNVGDPLLTRPTWSVGVSRDPDKLWLDKNENSDPELKRVTQKMLSIIPESSVSSYPDMGPAYSKLSAMLDVSPDQIIFGAGSDGVIRSVFETFISPGDRVVHTEPTFAMYFVYSRMFGTNSRTAVYKQSDKGPELSVESIISLIQDHRPKLICLPNPDSPTGTVFLPEEMELIISEAAEKGSLMLVDEAYYPFYSKSVLPLIKKYSNLIVTRSTGKAWGLAGIRLGYGVASVEVASYLHKVRSMYEIGAVSANLFNLMMDQEPEMLSSVRRLEEGKLFFLEYMKRLGFRTLNGHGNFMHVAFDDYADAAHQALKEIVYYRKDFNDPCLKGFSRFSSATCKQLRPIVQCIEDIVKNRS
jgi:histidinol-phosphate aminotransferase